MIIEQSKSSVVPFPKLKFESTEQLAASSVDDAPMTHNCMKCSVRREKDELIRRLFAWTQMAADRIAGLTPRQLQIMELVLAGHPSKNIAADLEISQRTVENHRASIMRKTGSKSVPALARLALAAFNDAEWPLV